MLNNYERISLIKLKSSYSLESSIVSMADAITAAPITTKSNLQQMLHYCSVFVSNMILHWLREIYFFT